MEALFHFAKKIIPKPVFVFFQPYYHRALSLFAALFYGFPSKKLKVIGVTGTNGKSTVVHLITSILEKAGERTASVSSLRFRINGEEEKNTLKMTMPGRFRLQKFLRRAVNKGCKHAVLEVTSEGIKQSRHKSIKFAIAVLTNVTPEHIESHGTFEKYRAAKAELFKIAPIHILNGNDPNIEYFLKIQARSRIVYSKKDLPQDIKIGLKGDFNLENVTAAYHTAKILGIDRDAIKEVLESTKNIPGRLEFVQESPFAIVVDYAHTPDALRKVYETLRPPVAPPRGKTLGVFGDSTPSVEERSVVALDERLICVLGSAGGGRDKWKRPEMGKIAAEFCNEIILTNEDPYDERPEDILNEIAVGFSKTTPPNPPPFKEGSYKFLSPPLQGGVMGGVTINYKKILDRREAIREAIQSAKENDIVVITGKGAEPWMMGPNGSKIVWDDREVVKEELAKLSM